MTFKKGTLLYENSLSSENDIESFRREGEVAITFPRGRMRMENVQEPDPHKGVHGNFLLWCEQVFPDNIAVSWDFRPLSDAGLAMFWIAVKGCEGEDLFDPGLMARDGHYPQYHHGDINALHVSYFRRNPGVTGFRTCNLRKSYGFHMVCQSGDPLPDARNALESYRMEVVKAGSHFCFTINDIVLIHWVDDGQSFGPVLNDGKIGFRQMAGLIAEYANLKMHEVA